MGVTGNARLLLGYVDGCLSVARQTRFDGPFYEVVEVDSSAGTAVIRNVETDNTYRLAVVQIEGDE